MSENDGAAHDVLNEISLLHTRNATRVSIRILQLTDLHLFTASEATLRGIPTWTSLVDVLQYIRNGMEAGEQHYDCLVITGDVAHDELATTYALLRDLLIKMLGKLGERCLIIPGNHDNRDRMRQIFGQSGLADNRWVCFSRELGDWRLIGLDSHSPGEVAGKIESAQIDWLKAQLTEHANQPTIVFLHHPPFLVQCSWLDSIGLREPEQLMEVIHSFPQIRVVSAGHVHQDYAVRNGGVEFVTSPSTAAQFQPASDVLTFENMPPGYRVFELLGDGYTSEVKRLPVLRFPPDSLI
jgi:Icc protein